MRTIACLLVATALIAMASPCPARTHTVRPYQQQLPGLNVYSHYGEAVGIDGDSIVTVADYTDGKYVLLYRRGANGQFAFSRILVDLVAGPNPPAAEIAMKNGVLAVRIGPHLFISERVGNDWIEPVNGPSGINAARIAISGKRIAVGTDPCLDDTVMLEKSSAGAWVITGRVTGPARTCTGQDVSADLNENTLLVRRNDSEVYAYVRPAQGMDWVHTDDFILPQDAIANSIGAPALQKNVAVTPGSAVFRRTGAAFNAAGFAHPVDYANGSGFAYEVAFRDGVLITQEGWGEIHSPLKPYVYVDNGTGFDHVAILETFGFVDDFDVSGRTVVAASDDNGERYVSVFSLPSPIAAPRPLVNDFQAQDTSGFELTPGSQFALARRGSNDVYRQSSLVTEAHAVLNGSDWPDFQSIEADITPTQGTPSHRWVGLGIRYVDEHNFYYLTATTGSLLQLKRKVNGVITTLWEQPFSWPLNRTYRVKLEADRDLLSIYIDGNRRTVVRDTTFKRGRAMLMAYRMAADFDNVYAAPTRSLNLAWKNWLEVWYDWGRHFDYAGGNWQLTGADDPDGLSQTTSTGTAYALVGTPTDEQSVTTLARLDSFNGTSAQVAWFGLLARYTDASNYYYLSLRSSNTLQIRRMVNGQLTVLASVPFTPSAGTFHELRFEVYRDQLHAYVDGVLRAQAIDAALPKGKYGLGTYRTAATFQTFIVDQP